MPEKRKSAYDLAAFRAAFSKAGKLAVTGTALRDAAAMGFGRIEIVAAIQTMETKHFYKSMTSHYDASVWQDVYHVPHAAGTLYVKFTADAVTEFKLISFKEK